MLVGCISIIIILGLMSIVFIRAHKKNDAMICVPLMLLPFCHTVVEIIVKKLISGPDFNITLVLVDSLALAFSVAMVVFLVNKVEKYKQKKLMVAVSSSYSAILCATLIINTWQP